MSASIADRLESVRVVPVAAMDDGDQAERAARALLAAGVDCIEITFRTPAAADAVRRARGVEGLLVGAGTLLTPAQVAEAVAAGAHFGVSPCLDEAVAGAARDAGLPFIPGVATASEINRARTLDFPALKLFPAAQLGGPAFIKAMAAVYPGVRFMPTGGVTLEALPEYLALPPVIAAGGGWLCAPELLRAGRFEEVERRAREAKAAVDARHGAW